jgi:hypothetical protein
MPSKMTPQSPNPTKPLWRDQVANVPWPDRVITSSLLLSISVFVWATLALAVYLLVHGLLHGLGDFEKIAIPALIAIVGTGMTATAGLYAVNRQAVVAKEVELLRANLAGDLDTLKTESADALERLKAFLDVGKTAYKELYGAASTYFYTLRSVAQGSWNDDLLNKAEAGMVEAARHLIYVDDKMRDVWFAFWQEAQHIRRDAAAQKDEEKRSKILKDRILEPVPDGRSKYTLRDRHFHVQEAARQGIAQNLPVKGES